MFSRQLLNTDILEIRLILMPGFWIGYQKYTRALVKYHSFVNKQLSCCCLLAYHVKNDGVDFYQISDRWNCGTTHAPPNACEHFACKWENKLLFQISNSNQSHKYR